MARWRTGLAREASADDGGASLMEVVASVAILSIALTALAGVSYGLAQRSLDSAVDSYASGIATDQLDRLSVLSLDSLSAQTGCVDVVDEHLPHERCVRVTSISASPDQTTCSGETTSSLKDLAI